MPIQNVHYWDSSNSPSKISSSEKKDSSTFFKNYSQSFDAQLFDMLGQGSFSSNSMGSNNFFGFDLNSADGLRQASEKADSMGMGKVLAAQLGSQLPFMNNSNNYNDDNDQGGLNGIANLTVQLQMAKARKVFDRLNNPETMSLESFIQSVNDKEEAKAENTNPELHQNFEDALSNLKNQIDKIAEDFGISYNEILENVDKP